MALSQFPNFPHQQMNAVFWDFMRKAKTSDLANNIKKKCYDIQMISAIFFRSDSMNSIRWELPIYSTWRGFFQRTTPLGDFFEFPKKPNEKNCQDERQFSSLMYISRSKEEKETDGKRATFPVNFLVILPWGQNFIQYHISRVVSCFVR